MTDPVVPDKIQDLLVALGLDVESDGLRDTPARVARSLSELLSGVGIPQSELVDSVTTFHDTNAVGQIVAIRDVAFSSICEHHLLPFHGTANLAYVPNDSGTITGLSKVARVLDVISRRPQVQERLTAQLFDVFDKALNPAALLVVLEATHLCMTCRGVRRSMSTTGTLKYGGLFERDPARRLDALALIGHARRLAA